MTRLAKLIVFISQPVILSDNNCRVTVWTFGDF